MSGPTVRRRPMQYSLFPTCPPAPVELAPTTGVGGEKKKHVEGSLLTLANRPPPLANNNDMAPTNTKQQQASLTHHTNPTISAELPPPIWEIAEKPLPLVPTGPKPPPLQPRKKAQPGPRVKLTILPYTQEDRSAAMEEVKSLYARGQYKQCTMRCKQILDGIKDLDNEHPIYSICLSFFAASSRDMAASMPHDRPVAEILQESLACFRATSLSIEHAKAGHDVCSPTASSSPHSTVFSTRSSVCSVFSTASACSLVSDASTRAESPSTFDEESAKRGFPPSCPSSRQDSGDSRSGRKKKVSFSLGLATLPSESEVSLSPVEESALAAFPAPPSSDGDEQDHTSTSPPPSSKASLAPAAPTPSAAPSSPYPRRYDSRLASLATQLDYHVAPLRTPAGLAAEEQTGPCARSHPLESEGRQEKRTHWHRDLKLGEHALFEADGQISSSWEF